MTTRRALLVACSQYRDPRLRTLRSPVHDVNRLGDVLGDPAIGAFDIHKAVNVTETEIRRVCGRFTRTAARRDTLLLYFACHGYKDIDGQLYLAACDTDLDDLAVTAFPAELLSRLIDRSPSRRVILILDCCFSGAISRVMTHRGDRDEVGLGDVFAGQGEGRAIITATKAEEYAWEPAGEPVQLRDNILHSVFAEALIEGLQTGAADLDGDGEVSLDDLYQYVYGRVTATGSAQTPSKWNFVQGKLFVAHRVPAATAGATGPTPDPAAGSARSPWDARLLNWRYPVTPAVKQLVRPLARSNPERYGWRVLENGEWTKAAGAFRAATDTDPSGPSAWWGRGLCHAVAMHWREAGDAFERVADTLDPDDHFAPILAGAILLGTVTLAEAGGPRAHELLDAGLERTPFSPQLLAHQGVWLNRPSTLSLAIQLDPDLYRDLVAVGVDVSEATADALAEVERWFGLIIRANAMIDGLRPHVPHLAARAAPLARPASRLPPDQLLAAHTAIIPSQRRALLHDVVNLHFAAEELLDKAVDVRAMALVEAIRQTISDVTDALRLTDRPAPVLAAGIPPRIES